MSDKKPPQPTQPAPTTTRPTPDPRHKTLDYVEKHDRNSGIVIMDTHRPPPPKPDNKP